MKRQPLVFAAALLASLLAISSARAATTPVDTIIHDGISTWVTTPNIIGIPGAVDIETYNGFSEFVAAGTFGLRDYYFDGSSWTFAPMPGATDYSRIANEGANNQGIFYALGADGRIDKVNNTLASVSTIFPAGTVTGPAAIESYHNFNDDFLVASTITGVTEYYLDGTWKSAPVVAAIDYIEIANNFGALGAFFALGADGRVDQLLQDQTFGTWSTTNILAPGTLTNPKYIESYDGNPEFVTVSSQGVRDYSFLGSWGFELMSSSPNYIAIVDNDQSAASYFALSVVVPEPSSLCLCGFGLVGLSAVRARRRRNTAK